MSFRQTFFRISVALILVSQFLLGTSAQNLPEKVDLYAINRIKKEALQNSQVMETVGYLTDVIGPRLTGSPGLKKAQAYTLDLMHKWGLSNPHPEAWEFGRGWSLNGFAASMISPTFSSLIAYPKAWCPSTQGPVRGEVVLMDVQTAADLEKYRGKLKGKIVLLAPVRPVPPEFTPQTRRLTDEELLKLANAPRSAPEPSRPQFTPEQRARIDLNYQKWQMLYAEDPALTLEPGGGDGGVVYVTRVSIPTSIDTPPEQRPVPWSMTKPKLIPQVVVAAEQYNRMVRIIERGLPVEVEVNIQASFHDDDTKSHNIIAEIPGTDLKDEVVMIGGCLDSWHTATGATDNAAGAAVALEVMRIIKTLGLKPRRTIRIGLWSAEEQGAYGSRAYVAAHFGSPGHFTGEYEKFSAYFNLDYGTGKIRGVYLQGNEAVRPIFAAWLAPFKDLEAKTLTLKGIGATDHNSFDAIGLPGFQFLRDFMENNPRTAHTNMDVYDHVFAEDLKQSSAVAAAFVYQAAIRNERLPRKPVK
jgi:carboxypeptidase Q